jgi:predicted GNAT family acetyltransferase
MRLDRFERVADFLSATGEFLVDREAEHNLILGVADSADRSPDLYEGPPYLAVAHDGPDIVGAALRTPPYNLILSEVDDPRVVPLLVDDLHAEPVPGLVGPPHAVRDFAKRWVTRRSGSWRVRLDQRVYVLRRVLEPRPTGGGMRAAGHGDEGLLDEWLRAFGHEALPAETLDLVRRSLEEWRRGGRRFWLWEDAGEPVSLVGAGSRTPNGIRIGPVYTPPPQRGRGYASALTAGVSALLLGEGRRFCFLYTDLANPTANRIYQAIGYEPVTDALMVDFLP